ncbi:hypothetical protein K4B79_18610 [Streptomyces lincolnensis]|uniref:hypothetical protein n=1 Tax=Streptomyces lincolnensis TaxID=1915 RepID=UPI001E6019B4|nr:hypothetical protein [Streptomyces lincolnensis]MCD7440227.1 hypothetical protein [Streptomyces lincolnensis]
MPDVVQPGRVITSELLTYRSPFVVAHGAQTANSAAINSATEVTVITTSSATFLAGRAYRFEFTGLIQHATASLVDLCYLRLRRGNNASIRDLRSVVVANRATANRNVGVELSVTCTPAATFTDTVILTASWDTGSTATFTVAATPSTPGLLTVWDVGPASDMPGLGTF